jgi:hypothetical protein
LGDLSLLLLPLWSIGLISQFHDHFTEGRTPWTGDLSLLLLPLWSIRLISQFHDHFTEGRTPWTGDQLVARPLPKHRTTQTQNKRTHTKHSCLVWDSNTRSGPASGRAKAADAFDRSATVTDTC